MLEDPHRCGCDVFKLGSIIGLDLLYCQHGGLSIAVTYGSDVENKMKCIPTPF